MVDRKHRHEDVQVRGVFDISAGGILCRFRNHLADRRLHFARVRLGRFVIEVQIHERLVDAVEVLEVSECDQRAITEAISLIRGQLREGVAAAEYVRAKRKHNASETSVH